MGRHRLRRTGIGQWLGGFSSRAVVGVLWATFNPAIGFTYGAFIKTGALVIINAR